MAGPAPALVLYRGDVTIRGMVASDETAQRIIAQRRAFGAR
jgi:hypothetical protein